VASSYSEWGAGAKLLQGQGQDAGFIDENSIFAETPEGIQNVLDVVKELTTWCGMEISVRRIFLLVIDKDWK